MTEHNDTLIASPPYMFQLLFYIKLWYSPTKRPTTQRYSNYNDNGDKQNWSKILFQFFWPRMNQKIYFLL